MYKTESVCLSVYLSVFLFLMRGHSCERICTKFSILWHPYTLQMVIMGVSLASAAAVHTPLQMKGELRLEIRN